MADCNHECSSCASSGGCQEKEQNERAINNTKGVKKVIGVVGGKGGVGKSLLASSDLSHRHYRAWILCQVWT